MFFLVGSGKGWTGLSKNLEVDLYFDAAVLKIRHDINLFHLFLYVKVSLTLHSLGILKDYNDLFAEV